MLGPLPNMDGSGKAGELGMRARKRSPFGAPDFTPLVARVCRTPFSERSTAKLQALAWRPSGSGHRTCQRADDLGIAMPSTTERLWPALKFQDFLGGATTTSQLPSGKERKVVNFLERNLRTTNAKDEKR